MKKFALLFALILALSVTTPVFAYTGVTGQVIDTIDNGGWTWGGDVVILNSMTGSIIATCMLDGTGNIVGPGGTLCQYNVSNALLPFLSLVPPAPGELIIVYIDFNCGISGTCSGGSVGTPASIFFPYPEATSALPFDVGQLMTGTGPNAVKLSGMSSASSLGVALVLALVAGGSVLVSKKLKEEREPDYEVPAIVVEGDLEAHAGSPTEDLLDAMFSD